AFEQDDAAEIDFLGRSVPFGRILIGLEGTGITLGTEICEDLLAVTPPSSDMVLEGANVVINLSASNELVSKSAYRAGLVAQQSARGICAYVYASAGVHESTTDTAFSGDAIIAENGALLSRGKRFLRDSTYITADIDIPRIEFDRLNCSNFGDSVRIGRRNFDYAIVPYSARINSPDVAASLCRPVLPHPFVPRSKPQRAANCEEIFNIQVAGLAKRLEHTGIKKVYVGISGGLDSTLALLVCHMTFTLLGLPHTGITGVTMPGFGTTGRTYNNALTLMRELGVSVMEIDIRESSLLHFRDIGHDPKIMDVTYENVQARERTQILMDLANKHGGLVIGTGDLSEMALGWCTYNGDHMSMYAVNCSVPKTLVRYLVEWIMQSRESEAVGKVLKDILDTPISPELLPPDAEGLISQMTEDLIGPYELHDFFLYYFLRQGTVPKKLLFLAEIAFDGKYTHDTIAGWLKVFYRRFFSQQFKRSCVPDGPKVGTVALSPRGDWRMSSDSQADAWMDF
ncbi:MAG: NAD(+) synthase, partial [Saccharofermentanales bacterium]